MIKFGTDGWRAILGEEFNEENVEKVTLAIGSYVNFKYGRDKLILVGYDPRKDGKKYAEFTAQILRDSGFRVIISTGVVPTPVLAYNALKRNACAVMITASHNPPNYLGIKFIPDYAGPATTEITNKIENYLKKPSIPSPNKYYSVEEADFFEDYYEHLKGLIDFEKIRTSLKTNIVFDGLYSASIGYFDKILKDNGIPFDSIRMKHDIHFGGLMPDPKPQYLERLAEKVKSVPNSIGLANDGDADRFGVLDDRGEYVLPDTIIMILAKHLQSKGLTGAIIKTVGSTVLIDMVANKLGLRVIETAVGFKHIGEAMRNNDTLIGGEESGGLSIKGHIPEKDGILANLLILETLAYSGKSIRELEKDLLGDTKTYLDRNDYKIVDKSLTEEILGYFEQLQDIDGEKITSKDKKDGLKLMLGEMTKILIRPSGTEPLLRVYFEADNKEKMLKLEKYIYEIISKYGQI